MRQIFRAIFGAKKPAAGRRPTRTTLSLSALDDRLVPSAVSLTPPTGSAQIQVKVVAPTVVTATVAPAAKTTPVSVQPVTNVLTSAKAVLNQIDNRTIQ